MRLWQFVAAAYTLRNVAAVDGPTGANNDTTPTAQDGDITIHYITVGKAANEFVPNSINAEPGDIVSFQFYPTNHSVIRAAYGYPCIPIEDLNYQERFNVQPFFSGFFPVDHIKEHPPTWNLTINHTQPIFFYCGAPGSCIEWAMLGAINANASTPISEQIKLARKSDYMITPGQPLPAEAHSSVAAVASSATATATSSSSAAPSNASEGSVGLSNGAVAGIAVGSAAGALALAALVFLLLRMRRLQKRLDEHDNNTRQNMAQASPYGHGTNPDSSRYFSGLPPYGGSTRAELDAIKSAQAAAWETGNNSPNRGSSPLASYTVYGQPVMAAPSPDLFSQRWSNNASPIRENQGRSAELDVRPLNHDATEQSPNLRFA